MCILRPQVFSVLAVLIICCILAVPPSSAKKIGAGYRLISMESVMGGGLVGKLEIKEKNNIYGPDIPTLKLFVKHESEDRLRVHITDAERSRWEVPYDLLPREKPSEFTQTNVESRNGMLTSKEYSGPELIFTCEADPFSFAVSRRVDGQTLFNTSWDGSETEHEMVFKDQYLELTTKLPEEASIYGLGENTQPHGIKMYPGDPYTLYTTDIAASSLNTDLYGSHPFYMDLRSVKGSSSAHGVLLLNSNGMDVFYRGSSLTYKIIGGVFDFYFFSGPTPLSVTDQYTRLIGRPAPMPYWAFGFHQCRWGYHNLSEVADVVENYRKAKIPLDVIWNDDDHMDSHKDFTLSPTNYPRDDLVAFIDRIHRIGMRYVVLIDPGINVNSSYGVYQRASADDVFIKYKKKPFLAQVWPGPVNFPDFLNPKTVRWWANEIHRFHDLVPVDGLWIDMNEASNFCSGLCQLPEGKLCPNGTGPGWVCCLDCTNITATRWDDPPYKINASGSRVPIGYKTIATSAVHYNGVLEYDAHSLYGFAQSVATHKALQGIRGKRPFILSRSTFVGSGKYVAHWTGDNKATWEDLGYSISTMLNFGMFGVPMVGSDICGFYPAPTEELCNRWIQLGAFYPFSRDHANFYSPRQELYQWQSVTLSARIALGLRYKLLPYMYTLNYEAHTKGAPIARPLFFCFPNYTECHNVSTQFLLGNHIMVSPVLKEGEREVTALFPPGTWYNMFNMTQAIVSKGQRITLDTPLHAVNAHLFQNSIIPLQRGGLVSKKARMTPFSLVVSFGNDNGEARGNLFLDNDELLDMGLGNGHSTYVDFFALMDLRGVMVWSRVQDGKFALDNEWSIEKLTLLGVASDGIQDAVLEIDTLVDNDSYVKMVYSKHDITSNEIHSGFEKLVMVEINGLSLPIGKNFHIAYKMEVGA